MQEENKYKKTTQFRFYAELNDFLKSHKRYKILDLHFNGRLTVKHAIEAQGEPHSEVDLIETIDYPTYLSISDGFLSTAQIFPDFVLPGRSSH